MNPHKVLGVEPNATPSEIKSAYRKLAKDLHPDRNGGSEEKTRQFHEVQAAYESLTKKPEQGRPHPSSPNFHPGQGGFHFSFDMDEMFQHMHRQMGNANVHAQAAISLESAFKGCTVDFGLNQPGQAPRTVTVTIPAGVGHGQTVRVRGAGGQADPNYPAGDLLVTIVVQQHPVFHRLGMTLATQINVDILDLLTGCEIEVPLIEGGTEKLRIMPNSSPESNYSIVGKGMTVPNSSSRGDLIVKLHPRFREFTEEQLEVLRSLK